MKKETRILLETRWKETIRKPREGKTGKVYGSYVLMKTEEGCEEAKKLIREQAEMSIEDVIRQEDTRKTAEELIEDIEIITIEKYGAILVGWILTV